MRTLEQIHNALLDEGFGPRYTGGGNRYFGDLQCAGTRYPVWVEIPDADLVEHPVIALVERPPEIPLVCAHIGAHGHICYSTSGRDVMDPYRPADQIRACLRAAEEVLCKALRGDCLGDTQAEFHAYWKWAGALVADVPPDAMDGWVDLYEVLREGERAFYLAASDAAVYERAGYTVNRIFAGVYVTSSRNRPVAAGGDWPPETLGQLAQWLKSIDDGRPYKALHDAIRERHKSLGMALLMRTPGSWWAVLIKIDPAINRAFKQSAARWVKHVFAHGDRWPVTRLLVDRADPAHLVSRNLAGRTGLADKRILLAGCGTIGGYLADLLARAGAGAGRGELILCDPDVLKPGNIGRHYLGVDSLWEPKARAMVRQLARALPHQKVTAAVRDVRDIPFDGFDLIVDATGAEGLSLALNSRLAQRAFSPPAVFVWNEGGGVASQCLLVDSPKAACFRCLNDENGRPRFSPLLDPAADPFVMGAGCDAAYVPYPAMISMQAAAMASSLILDWADGRPGKRLRSRTFDHWRGKQVRDTNPERHSRCPACS